MRCYPIKATVFILCIISVPEKLHLVSRIHLLYGGLCKAFSPYLRPFIEFHFIAILNEQIFVLVYIYLDGSPLIYPMYGALHFPAIKTATASRFGIIGA